jgi:transcriptional regulator with XRE-family HTH domain
MQREFLGKRIKEARKRSKLTQENLAEKVNISTVYLGEIERGNKMPSIPVFIAIAEALGVSCDFLLRDSVDTGAVFINNEITEKLNSLSVKQRKAVLDIINAYIKSI